MPKNVGTKKESVELSRREKENFVPDSVKNTERKRKRQRVIDKVNRKRQELLAFDDNSYKSKRRKK